MDDDVGDTRRGGSALLIESRARPSPWCSLSIVTDWILVIGVVSILLEVAAFARIATKGRHLMTTALENVQASTAAIISKDDALLAFAASTKDLVVKLQAQIAALGNADPALQAVADQLTAEAAKVDAFLSPPPSPDPTPVISPSVV